MPRFSCRQQPACISLCALLIALLPGMPAGAQTQTNAAGQQNAITVESNTKTRLKIRVVAPDGNGRGYAQSSSPNSLADQAKLWIIIDKNAAGFSIDAHPDLKVASSLAAADVNELYADMRADVQLQNRVNAWKSWLQNIMNTASSPLLNADLGPSNEFYVGITVTKDRTITLSTDSAHGPHGADYAEKITAALTALNHSKALEFPEGTHEQQIHFDIKTGSFRNLLLECINQGLH